MVFGSVGECIAYIEAAIQDCMPPLSIEIKRIMDEVTLGQVRGWSGQIFSSVIPSSGGMSAEASFEDTGSWYSLAGSTKGQEVGNPIKFLEAGTTWNRGATSIMATALGRCEGEIPQKFCALMRAHGIPIS